MGKSFFCVDCNQCRKTKIIQKEETYSVKGVDITKTNPVRICSVCGREIYDRNIDSKTLEKYYEEYENITGKKIREGKKSESI